MAQHHVTASALIPAPAQQIYALIADYHVGHPSILPKPYFLSLDVIKGGVGAGTVITFQMQLMGRVQTFHGVVSEPEPGRVLVETYSNPDSVTTFTVEPRDEVAHDGGSQAYVTITTQTIVPDGPLGTVQGWLTTQLLRPIYLKELDQLAAVAVATATAAVIVPA